MNLEFLITRTIYENPLVSQRVLAKKFFISLGKINATLSKLVEKGLLVKKVGGKNYEITDKGIQYVEEHKVDKAIIFACGMGVRLAPLTYDTPKCFIRIKGERMIERQIEQLKASGIDEITIMVGYLKEKFDYLIDKYGVKLKYNEEYKYKNTLSTFYHARDLIRDKNVYICVSDVYMSENIFHGYEIEPYYIGAFYEDCKNEWRYVTNSKNEIKGVEVGGVNDFCLVGHAFLTKEFANTIIPIIEEYYNKSMTDNYYWEDVLVRNLKKLPTMYVYKLDKGIINEFDSLKDIEDFDNKIVEYGSKAISFVSKAFGIKDNEVKNIICIKEGMTNRSYRFTYGGIEYVARIPGEDSSTFINRKVEGEILEKLADKNITEEVVYFDKESGYKIAKFFTNGRTIDTGCVDELKKSMALYKKFHTYNLSVDASADICDMIEMYLDIINNKNLYVPYEDFDEVISNARKLRDNLKKENRPKVLCHGDANPDNVLIVDGEYKLIDFEYGGMADPLTDIALFSSYVEFDLEKTLDLYAYYKEASVDASIANLIPESDEKAKYILMAYTALSGLYNAVWAIVRSELSGLDYGNYGMERYRLFKDYYKLLNKM